jgi:hypothetical protein
VSFGKAAPGQSHPAVFLHGIMDGTEGVFRSDDAGATWVRINDDSHRYGYLTAMAGDPRTYGLVYLGTGGRGILSAIPVQTQYVDGLTNSWANQSTATVNLAATSPVIGTNSISVTAAASQALYLRKSAVFDSFGYQKLTFSIHGGTTGGQVLKVYGTLAGVAQSASYTLPALTANTWTSVTVPLSALGVANQANMDGIQIKNTGTTALPVFYVDNLSLQ